MSQKTKPARPGVRRRAFRMSRQPDIFDRTFRKVFWEGDRVLAIRVARVCVLFEDDYVKNRQPDHCSPEMRTSLLNVAMDGPEVQRTIQAMVSNKVALNSTLAVYELSYPDRPPLEDRVLEAMAPETREEYLSARCET